MKPISFDGQNCVYAENQEPYIPLPAFRYDYGKVVSCWKLTFGERIKLLLAGRIWVSILTFNKPLQPFKISLLSGLVEKEKK